MLRLVKLLENVIEFMEKRDWKKANQRVLCEWDFIKVMYFVPLKTMVWTATVDVEILWKCETVRFHPSIERTTHSDSSPHHIFSPLEVYTIKPILVELLKLYMWFQICNLFSVNCLEIICNSRTTWSEFIVYILFCELSFEVWIQGLFWRNWKI